MAKGPTYRLAFRRRREQKTNYRIRKGFMKGRKTRLAVRVTNKYTKVSGINAKIGGDSTEFSVNSRNLIQYGWLAGFGNMSAAYLTGYLAGRILKQTDSKNITLDLGLSTPFRGSKQYAVLKGVIDSGVEIPHNTKSEQRERADIFPEQERIEGRHIASYAEKLKNEDKEEYDYHFSEMLARGFKPEDTPEYFAQVLSSIEKAEKIEIEKGSHLSSREKKDVKVKIPESKLRKYLYEPISEYQLDAEDTTSKQRRTSRLQKLRDEAAKNKAQRRGRQAAPVVEEPSESEAVVTEEQSPEPEVELSESLEITVDESTGASLSLETYDVSLLPGLGKVTITRLNENDINNLDQLLSMSDEEIKEISKASLKKIKGWRSVIELIKHLGLTQDEMLWLVVYGEVSSLESMSDTNAVDVMSLVQEKNEKKKVKLVEMDVMTQERLDVIFGMVI